MSNPVPIIVGEVLKELQRIQGQPLPPPSSLPRELLAGTEILGQDPGMRRPPTAGGPGAALVAAWQQAGNLGRRFVAVRGNGQFGKTGANLTEVLAVRITDSFGKAVSGIPVKFAVTAGGGKIIGTTPSTNTDANGVASSGPWELGPSQGFNTVVASVNSVPAVTFTAVAV